MQLGNYLFSDSKVSGTIARKTDSLHVHIFGLRPVCAINFSRDQSSAQLINFLDSRLDTRDSRLDPWDSRLETQNIEYRVSRLEDRGSRLEARGSRLEALGTVNLLLSGTVRLGEEYEQKVISKVEKGLNFVIMVEVWFFGDDFLKKHESKKGHFCRFSLTLKTVSFVLVQPQKAIFGKNCCFLHLLDIQI